MSKTEDRLEESGVPTQAAGNGRVTDEAVATPEKTLPFAAYVPMGALSHYEKPKSTIDPDREKGWIKRATPIVMAHKVQWFSALIFSFLGLIIQVWIPKILQNGITNSLINRTQPLHGYVELIGVLAVATGVFGYISRTNLFKVAYAIEFDLRNIIYEHFTRMSFPFYDRVQSGQLISRANSDIRSVQMYLTFAPMILVQCSIALVAFAFMLSISVPLAFVAMAAMPFIYLVGVRMRQSLFPVSWIIQARLAEVATVVDENVNGVRVVRSFAAEQQQLRQLATAADRVQWGYIKDADLRARFAPLVQNLSQVGLVLVLLVGGWFVIHDHLPVASIVSFNLYLIMMQAPFMMLGMLIMMGQRPRPRPNGFTRSSTSNRRSLTGRTPSTSSTARATSSSTMSPSPTRPTASCRSRATRTTGAATSCATSTCTSIPARPWPSWGGPAAASRAWRGSWRASTTPPAAPCGWTVTTCATSP